MTTIFFVRHGLVENPKEIFYARLSGYHLSEKGREEAHRAALLLKNEPIEALYASRMERTMETAEIISKSLGGLTIQTDDRILEIRSPLEGHPEDELRAIGWNHYTENLIARGGETIEDIVTRLKDFYFEKAGVFSDKKIALVSHGELMMISSLLGRGIKPSHDTIQAPGYPATGSVMELMIDPDAKSIHLLRVF
ncbi:histidine phosphatase family protein [Candidatus Gottesmanbacteria bacterium]|nr:histidine phosphatase family protein [Candidatus Gottesmanbacteria bacterium]